MALAPYSGLFAVSGRPGALLDGFPKTATAATWSATLGGIGAGTKPRGNGTPAEVMTSMTAAPREYPTSTILVLGQFAAVYWT
jgi:hypothetical protein